MCEGQELKISHYSDPMHQATLPLQISIVHQMAVGTENNLWLTKQSRGTYILDGIAQSVCARVCVCVCVCVCRQ